MTELILKAEKSLLVFTVVFLSICLNSCMDRYWPEITKYENLLVVDGLLTDGDDPVIVKLSISSSINDKELFPVSYGELYITDENQTETPLAETEPGTYQVLDSSFCGKVGSDYKLHINLADGRNYESDIGRLPPPSPIDSVYCVIKSFDIHNVNNPEEAISGYFTVASITEKRIFVNRPLAVPFYYLICEPFFEILEGIVYISPEFWPIYLTYIPDRGLAGAAQESCFDCRLEGGSLTPPDFWEE